MHRVLRLWVKTPWWLAIASGMKEKKGRDAWNAIKQCTAVEVLNWLGVFSFGRPGRYCKHLHQSLPHTTSVPLSIQQQVNLEMSQ